MTGQRRTALWERGLSLLLAVVMTVSGTGLTAFAADIVPEEQAEALVSEVASAEAETDEEAAPEEHSAKRSADETVSAAEAAEQASEPESVGTETPPSEEGPEELPAVEELPEDPAEEQPSEPVEEPTDEPAPGEPTVPVLAPLSVAVKGEGDIVYALETESEVVSEEIAVSGRMWDEEERDKYCDFTDDLPEEQQIVTALVLSDGTEAEAPVIFAEPAEVFLSSADWSWDGLTEEDILDIYTLFLPDEAGELQPAEYSVRFFDDEENEYGNCLVFEADALSVLLLTRTVEPEEEAEEPADGTTRLVEVSESPNERLLADDELTATTRRLLGEASGSNRRAAPARQEPVTGGGMSIDKVTVRWLSRSTGSSQPAGYDRLELRTDNDTVGNQQFQIDFALSGMDVHEPGSIEVVIPAYLWLDRDGKEPGYLTLSVPEDPEKGADFAWIRKGDNIVLTNTHRLSAATKVMIQGTFRGVAAHQMVDIDTVHEDARYQGVSDLFTATVNLVVSEDEVLTMTSNAIDASINTLIQAASAVKSAYNFTTKEYYAYHELPSSLPQALAPEHPEDYFYVRWYISGSATGGQPFTMTVTDTPENAYGCIVLGAEGVAEGTVKSLDGKTVSAVLYEGYNTYSKSAYIWTAYPKSAFEEGKNYTVSNTQTITVTGADDGVVTTKTATATAPIRMPIIYTVVKQWNDNNDAEGHRPTAQSV